MCVCAQKVADLKPGIELGFWEAVGSWLERGEGRGERGDERTAAALCWGLEWEE